MTYPTKLAARQIDPARDPDLAAQTSVCEHDAVQERRPAPEHTDVPEQTVWTEVAAYFNLPIRWDLLTRVSPEEAERFANDMDDLEQRRRSLHAQMVTRSDRFLCLVRESGAVTPKKA